METVIEAILTHKHILLDSECISAITLPELFTGGRDSGTQSGCLQRAMETMPLLPLQLLQAVIGYYCKLRICNTKECMTPYDVACVSCLL